MRRAAAMTMMLTLAVAVLPFGGGAVAAADEIRDGQWYLADYGFDQVWQTTKGDGVVVAVIDSGIDADHPDLAGAVVAGTDLTGSTQDGLQPTGTEAGKPHGTAVASLIAGRGHGAGNRDGVMGVAPEAEVMSVAMATNIGEGGDQIYEQLPKAINFAVDNGADVINISLGEGMDEFNPFYEPWSAALAHAAEQNVVVVASAGNQYAAGVEGPANMPSVLAVASVGDEGTVSPGVSAKGPEVAVAAPGSTSQCPEQLDPENPCQGYPAAAPGDGYVSFTGSSGASPIVAGTAALIIAAHPGISAADVVNRLISTAKNPSGAGERDQEIGYGVIDPVAAVSADVPSVAENPLGVPAGVEPSTGQGDPSTPADPPTDETTPEPSVTEPLVTEPSESAGASPSVASPSADSSENVAPTTDSEASAAPTTTGTTAGSVPLVVAPPRAAEVEESGMPVWAWVLIAVVVVAGVGVVVAVSRRGRGPGGPAAGGPAGPPDHGFGPGYPTGGRR